MFGQWPLLTALLFDSEQPSGEVEEDAVWPPHESRKNRDCAASCCDLAHVCTGSRKDHGIERNLKKNEGQNISNAFSDLSFLVRPHQSKHPVSEHSVEPRGEQIRWNCNQASLHRLAERHARNKDFDHHSDNCREGDHSECIGKEPTHDTPPVVVGLFYWERALFQLNETILTGPTKCSIYWLNSQAQQKIGTSAVSHLDFSNVVELYNSARTFFERN